MQAQTSRIPTFNGFKAGVAAPRPAARRVVVQRQQLCVRAATVAAPVELEVKNLDGSTAGSTQLALKVAGESAKVRGAERPWRSQWAA